MAISKIDERGIELARQMEQAAADVRRTIAIREWLISEGADYDVTLAQFEVWYDEAEKRYTDYLASA